MRRFEYRAPRFPTDVSVELMFQNITLMGRCVQISFEGMRGRFDKPLQEKTLATVSITYRDARIEVPVEVAYCTPNFEGLRFLFDSDAQRNAVKRLVNLMTAPLPRHGLVLMK